MSSVLDKKVKFHTPRGEKFVGEYREVPSSSVPTWLAFIARICVWAMAAGLCITAAVVALAVCWKIIYGMWEWIN